MLKWIKRLLAFLILVLAVVVGIVFTLQNSEPVSLIVFSVQLPKLSLGLWLTIALFGGAIIGLLISLLPILFSQRSSRDKKIRQLQKELASLRISGIKG